MIRAKATIEPKNEEERRLKNSAEWIIRGHRGTRFYILHETHDSIRRETKSLVDAEYKAERRLRDLNDRLQNFEESQNKAQQEEKQTQSDLTQLENLIPSQNVKLNELRVERLNQLKNKSVEFKAKLIELATSISSTKQSIKESEVTVENAKKTTDCSQKKFYFPYPKGSLFPKEEPGTYEQDLDLPDDIANVYKEDSKTSLGWRHGSHIAVYFRRNEKPSDDDLCTTLMHEVQHLADRHDDSKDRDTQVTWQDALVKYKTEFRAFYYSGEFKENLSKPPETWEGRQWSSIQLRIFKVIYDMYRVITNAWDEEQDKPDQPFRNAVHAYSEPESPNPENSVDLDDFNANLEKLKDDSADSLIATYLKPDAPKKLTASEAKHILDGSIWKKRKQETEAIPSQPTQNTSSTGGNSNTLSVGAVQKIEKALQTLQNPT